MALRPISEFIKIETASGLLLFAAAVIALLFDNSPWRSSYQFFTHLQLGFHIGNFHLVYPIVEWMNQGLMTIFFLLVSLEIKREIFSPELNTYSKIILPAIAACGGMLIPACIYSLLNWHDPIAMRGWAIPCATDVAFALGILSLLHGRIPVSLKIFLTALAIFDDLGAIIIIAIFYTEKIVWIYLGLAAVCSLCLLFLNLLRIKNLIPYLCLGFGLWFLILLSGVHAVIAGVILALAIPLQGKTTEDHSPLRKLEHLLHPWVAFFILPLFGFLNAGVSFIDTPLTHWFSTVAMGIILALFIGKQLGVFTSVWLAVRLKWAELPDNMHWLNLYGIALLCGVGFTMSLFIGNLAFANTTDIYQIATRFGVLIGSLISGLIGYLLLSRIHRQ